VLVNVTVVDGNIDTFAPQPPVIITPGPGSTVPGDNSVTVSGTAEPGTTVTVTIGTTTVTTTATDTGSYLVDVPGPFPDGPTTVTVVATDASGNESEPSSQNFNIGGSSGGGTSAGGGENTGNEDGNTLDQDSTVVLGGVAGCSCGSNAPPDASFLFLAAALVGLRLRRASRKRQ
jgi:MYXO-CTERM domain-containing protein